MGKVNKVPPPATVFKKPAMKPMGIRRINKSENYIYCIKMKMYKNWE